MTRNNIQKLFGGRLVGNQQMKELVIKAVAMLPDEVAHYVVHRVWFLSSTEDAWAFTFHGNDVKDKHFIFISDELLEQPRSQIEFTILHEIGHIVKHHRNSIGYKQSRSEIHHQEEEADEFAKLYLEDNSK